MTTNSLLFKKNIFRIIEYLKYTWIHTVLIFFTLLSTTNLSGQIVDTLPDLTLETITVTAYKEKSLRKNGAVISTLSPDSNLIFSNFNLTDLITRIPGVNMLSTGPAINKPVIRGSFGNRILILLNGLKFDNQQWQDEHGLGLSDLGLEKIEVIKGPLSVLYGSEALGGIINLIEEGKPQKGTQISDWSIKLHSNTLGLTAQTGTQKNIGNRWWRLRIGIDSHADYQDGNADRVLNSRFQGYYLKGTYGFQRKKWTSVNNLLSSFTQSGFIFNDIYNFISADRRWSRKLSVNPSHLVFLNILSSQNKIELPDHSNLNVNVGIQSNERLENEGGGAISLNMHLLTVQYLIKWEKKLSEKNQLILSHMNVFENNTNYGSRKIVPDANLQEANASVYLETVLNKNMLLENGIGIGEKYIKSRLTPSVNSAEKEIDPFSKFSDYYNFFSGLAYYPNSNFTFKVNLSSGVRIPNLAELSSNGLHEGIFTYEIGDPTLRNEKNISGNILLQIQYHFLKISITPFYNYFLNYVYLTPTQEEWFGFPIYRYQQKNANQLGTECEVTIQPHTGIQAHILFSEMVSRTRDGQYTPFVPPKKLTPDLHFNIPLSEEQNCDFYIQWQHTFKQTWTAPVENPTPGYETFDLGLKTSWQTRHGTFIAGLSVQNIFNEKYFDHLSRLKDFGLLNMGRNFTLNLKMQTSKI